MTTSRDGGDAERSEAAASFVAAGGRERRSRRLMVLRWVSIGVIAASLAVVVRSLPLAAAMDTVEQAIAGLGFWGPLALILLYVAATVLLVPGSLLTLMAGALFGLAVGMLAASIGSTCGAGLAFLISRYLARERVAAMAHGNRRFQALDQAIGEGGWRIVVLLRLSPAIPFNLQNYLYGLTPIRFGPYLLASWLAMLPGTFLYVYLGYATGAAVGTDRARTPAEWMLLVVGLLATAAVTIYITRLARRKLNEQVARSETNAPP